MERPENCILVIFGASGDLTRRKLVPGLFNLYRRNLLPEGFAIYGLGRTELDDATFRDSMREAIHTFVKEENIAEKDVAAFIENLYYQTMNIRDLDAYTEMKRRLDDINSKMNTEGNYVFYMSTPPRLFGAITEGLAHCKMNKDIPGESWRRLIVEKPFGYDLETARELNETLHKNFKERQIYRIDHYLGKETVQNMLVFRFANGLFEPLWNRNYIEYVEITSAESIGVGSRGGYYDGSGALRDMFQNHLLQVVGMIAMEPPAKFEATAVRNETIKVFNSLRPIPENEVGKYVIKGQYTESKVRGESIKGYRDEEGVPDDSKTATYVAVKFFVDNWRWGGVPFYVRTGKCLPTRVTEAVIHFKQTPHQLFGKPSEQCYQCNQLIIRIQPDEGILMKFNMKLPGSGFEVRTVNMDFHYSDLSNVYVPQAYERLLLDCMLGDATLYARGDAVEACWEFVDPILKAWENDGGIKVYGYPAGSWGPTAARELFNIPEGDWRYPCKNLAEDGEYCEL